MPHNLNDFERAFFEAALWSSTDDDGISLDSAYTIGDIAPVCLEILRRECAQFCDDNAADICATSEADQAGHDFWLTRNEHGVGFWDRGYGPAGDRLSDACKAYGEVTFCVGDDGQIWAFGYETEGPCPGWLKARHPKRLGGG